MRRASKRESGKSVFKEYVLKKVSGFYLGYLPTHTEVDFGMKHELFRFYERK